MLLHFIESPLTPSLSPAGRGEGEGAPCQNIKCVRISSRLKVQVLMRDSNKCKLCGTTVTGENIDFDHIKPWSKGGETVLENVQVLCASHNLAKGDLE